MEMKKSKMKNEGNFRFSALFLAVLILIASLPLSALANAETSILGQTGEFVTPISATTEVSLGDGVKVDTFDGISTYLKKTEVFSNEKYETYPSLKMGVAIYYDSIDTDKDGYVDSVKNAMSQKNYHRGRKRDMIVYSINYIGERIGTEDDVSILLDYINEGYVVLVVDFNLNPLAKVPNLEHAIAKVLNYYAGTGTADAISYASGVAANGNFTYTLPSGYRLARDIWYWNSFYYAALGTRERVLEGWNNTKNGLVGLGKKYSASFEQTYRTFDENGDIITVTKSYESGSVVAPADYIYDCVKRDGSNLTYDCYLDIIYPSKPIKSTPVHLQAATDGNRFSNVCTDARCTVTGLLFSGYTFVNYDFVYIPMAHNDAYGYYSHFNTVDYNAVKPAQAAVRCVRYYARKYGYDATRLSSAGLSKGSPTAAVMAFVDNEQMNEKLIFAQDEQLRATGINAAFEGDIIVNDERLTIQQPFLYYDVPYGPVLDENGNIQRDVYGNVITYEYYGEDGKQYIRTAAIGDLRTSTHDEGDKYECDEGFRAATGKSIDVDYVSVFDDNRKSTDTFNEGTNALILERVYGSDNIKDFSPVLNNQKSYYYYIDTDVTAAYVAAGLGPKRFTDSDVSELELVPLVLSIGTIDYCEFFRDWDSILAKMTADAVNPYFPNTMQGQDHVYPTDYDFDHGYRRHDAFVKFFNHYMKPEEYNYAELIFASPVEGTRIVLPSASVELKFYDKMNVDSVKNGAVVRDADGNSLSGTWLVDEVDTHFTFKPNNSLTEGETYTIYLDADIVEDATGRALNKDYQSSFTVTSNNVIVNPIDDCFVSSAQPDTALHTVYTKKFSLQVKENCDAYVTFNKADIIGKSHLIFEAVDQTDMTASSFKVTAYDGLRVDSKTTYNNLVLGTAIDMGEVLTDKYGVGEVSLSALGDIDGEGVITFRLSYNGDDVVFQSTKSPVGTVGVRAVGRIDVAKPIATAYTSKNNPTTNYLNPNTLYAGDYNGDECYTFLTFNVDDLIGKLTATLSITVNGDEAGPFAVYALDDFEVNSSLNYNNMPTISAEQLIGTAKIDGEGQINVTLSSGKYIGKKVTLVITSEIGETATNKGSFTDFEKENFVSVGGGTTAPTTTVNPNGDVRVGGSFAAYGRVEDPDDSNNHVFIMQTKANPGRVKFHNFWSDTSDLTLDDVGKKVQISFKAKSPSQKSVMYGLMRIDASRGEEFYRADITEDWTTIVYNTTITQEMVNLESAITFFVENEGAYTTVYIDDVKAQIIGFSASILADTVALYSISHAHEAAQIKSDRYLKSAGSCSDKAIYYESCAICGKALISTFEGDYEGSHIPEDNAAEDGCIHCSLCGTIMTFPDNTVAGHSDDNGTTWIYTSTIEEAFSAISGKNGLVRIHADVNVSNSLIIPVASNITLSSYNNNKITRTNSNQTFESESMFVLETGSSLTLKNITVDGNEIKVSTDGSIAKIPAGSSITIDKGTVIERAFSTNLGGAFFVNAGAVLYMNDGIIKDCGAKSGGAIYLDVGTSANNTERARFIMTDGLITGCKNGFRLYDTARFGFGSAVGLKKYAVMEMSGGIITGNYAGRKPNDMRMGKDNDGAVTIYDQRSSKDEAAKLKVSGNAVIYGNFAYGYTDSSQNGSTGEIDTSKDVTSDISTPYNSVSDLAYSVDVAKDFNGTVGIYGDRVGCISSSFSKETLFPSIIRNDTVNGVKYVARVQKSWTRIEFVPAVIEVSSEEIDVTSENFYVLRGHMLDGDNIKDILNHTNSDNVEICLLSDVTLTGPINIPADAFTFNGFEHTLTRGYDEVDNMFALPVNQTCDLTVKNLTIDGDNRIIEGAIGFVTQIYNGQTISLENVNILNGGTKFKTGVSNSGVAGAICVYSGGTLDLNSSSIQNCTTIGCTKSGAVFCDVGAVINLSGDTKITNNLSDSTESNLYLHNNDTQILVNVLALDEESIIGINMYTSGLFSNGGAEYINNFASDNTGYTIVADGDNLKLIEVLLGDLDGDCCVTNKDLEIMRKYLLGQFSPENLDDFYINEDKEINIADLVRLSIILTEQSATVGVINLNKNSVSTPTALSTQEQYPGTSINKISPSTDITGSLCDVEIVQGQSIYYTESFVRTKFKKRVSV